MKQKNFFLISFIPAIAYWYLEENYTLQIALIGGLFLSVLEISLEKIFTAHVHSLSKMNFFLILFLGLLSLLAQEGIWFKLQPMFTGVILFLVFMFKKYRGGSFLLEMASSMPNQLPDFILKKLEFHMAIFLGLYGVFMGWVALSLETDRWLFFKTVGFYIAFFIFMILEMIVTRKSIKEHYTKERILPK